MAISKMLYIGDCGSGYAGKHLKQALDYIVEDYKTGQVGIFPELSAG